MHPSPSIREAGTFNCWWWCAAGCGWWWCGGCICSRCDLVWEKVGDGGSQGRATPVLAGTSSSWQQNLSLAFEAVVPVQFATPCPSLLLLISPLLLLLLLLPLLLLFVRRVVVAPVAGLPLPLALPLTLPLPMPSTCTISLSIAAADLAVPGGVATPPPIIITRRSHLRPLHAQQRLLPLRSSFPQLRVCTTSIFELLPFRIQRIFPSRRLRFSECWWRPRVNVSFGDTLVRRIAPNIPVCAEQYCWTNIFRTYV